MHSGTTHAPGARRTRISVLSSEFPQYACAQLRLLAPFHALATQFDLHWLLELHGRTARINLAPLASADLVIVQRHFPSAQTAALLERVLSLGVPVVYETDDLFTCAMPVPGGASGRTFGGDPVSAFIARADAVTVSTSGLARALLPLNRNITVVPNLIDESLWTVASRQPARDRVTIGYAGTPTHAEDLLLIEEPLARIGERYADRVAFVFMGCVTDRLRGLPNATIIPFTANYPAYARRLPQLGVDIGLAPLRDTPFNRMKSDIKWLEYSMSGAAGVYSDVGQFRDTVEHLKTGMLTDTDPHHWYDCIEYLIREPDARRSIANTARDAVLRDRTLRTGATTIRRLVQKLLTKSGTGS
jgi:glycosyltransferase involved in cell wall biosynthesis